MKLNYDITVIGGGPAGLAAALAANERGAERILILERDTRLGGILCQCIHNGFGLHYFKEELTGPEYAQRFIDELSNTSIDIKLDTMVLSIDTNRNITAINTQDGLLHIQSKAIILAMGCRERTRGALGIPGTRPSGVYTAGSAQYMVNMQNLMPGNEVVILGSGDIGLIMARRLTWEGAKVKMVCEIMPHSSGLSRNIAQCLDDNDIPLLLQHTVVQIHGRSRLEGVTIASVDKNFQPIPDTYQYVPCDTLLLSVGLIPENELSQDIHIDMDPVTKGAVVDERRQTNVPGVFACGNVLHVHDLVDNVSYESTLAGHAAVDYIHDKLTTCQDILVRPSANVTYCLPQHIRSDIDKVDIYYRVRNVIQPAIVEVKCDGVTIKRNKKPILTPGEMEKITISLPKECQKLTVHVQEVSS